MHELLIVDTETGGVDPREFSVLSLAAVVWRGGRIEGEFDVFIAEPELKSEPEAMAINRIDLGWLRRHGVPPAEAVERFHAFLRANLGGTPADKKISLVGHNVNFDVGFLRRLYSFTGHRYEDYFSHRVMDTASIIRFLILAGKLPLENASLSAALEFFGIKVEKWERHTALADARATAELLNHAIRSVA